MCRRTCCPFFWGGIGIISNGNCCGCNNAVNNSNSGCGCGCSNCCGN